MEIRINGKTYEAPDSCPIDGPRKGTLKRHLNQHGVESFLSSDKYGEYAACILEELETMGAEAVEPTETVETVAPAEPEAVVAALEALLVSSEALSGRIPETTYVEAPGAVQDSSGEEPV